MVQSEKHLLLKYFMASYFLFYVSCFYEFSVTRGKHSDELKPDNCTAVQNVYSTSYCHRIAKSCPGRCICLNRTTLLLNQNNELKCEGDFAKKKGCDYAIAYALNLKNLKTVDSSDLKYGDVLVGEIVLRERKKLKNCALFQDKSSFWNLTKWSPLFADNKRYSDIYLNGDDLKLKKGSHMEEAYKGLLINITIQCEDKDGNPHPKSCVMFKVSGGRKYIVGSIQTTTKTPTTEPSSSQQGRLLFVIFIGIVVPIVLILLIAGAVYCNKRRKMSAKCKVPVAGSTTMDNKKVSGKKPRLFEDSELTHHQSNDQREIYSSSFEIPLYSTIPADNNNISYKLEKDSYNETPFYSQIPGDNSNTSYYNAKYYDKNGYYETPSYSTIPGDNSKSDYYNGIYNEKIYYETPSYSKICEDDSNSSYYNCQYNDKNSYYENHPILQ